MNLKPLDKAISLSYLAFDITASLQGTAPYTAGTLPGEFEYSLSNIISNDFTTVFSESYKVEDVGNIEVFDIYIYILMTFKGDGSVRVQLSGDGGNTWTIPPCAQGNFNNVGFIQDSFLGSGEWLSNIQPGNDKLQIRIQLLANSGTVETTIFNASIMELIYRKKVLS